MTSLKRASGLLLALALVLGLQAVAYAQTGAATLTGLVTDQSGAAVPGVTVRPPTRARTSIHRRHEQAGNYTIASVPVGTYVVKSALSGFKTSTTKPMSLEAKQIARLDLKMELGALEDTVEVTAEATVLGTQSATVGEVHLRQDGPRPCRSTAATPASWHCSCPGGITPNPDSFTTRGLAIPAAAAGPTSMATASRRTTSLIDGIDMNETVDNRIAYQPSPDALAEISVETNNYAADVGNVAGAVISNVIKSGANQFKGNLFEFYRNSDFDANTWSNNRSGAKKAERKQHIFGATLGGPIIKNKLFFFVRLPGHDPRPPPPRRRARAASAAAPRLGARSRRERPSILVVGAWWFA